MKILVKFCGMTRQQDVLQAAELGVDYLGFVLVPDSKRCLTHDALQSLLRVVPDKVKTVLVVANLELPEIQRLIADFQPDVIQLHGNESAELVAKIRGVEVWKAVQLRNEQDLRQAAAYPCERLVVDAGKGGSGQLCDWSLAAKLARIRDIFLAGGITPENITAALQQTKPAGIDTASGIESEPGKKDPEKMRKFLQFRVQGNTRYLRFFNHERHEKTRKDTKRHEIFYRAVALTDEPALAKFVVRKNVKLEGVQKGVQVLKVAQPSRLRCAFPLPLLKCPGCLACAIRVVCPLGWVGSGDV